MADLTKKQRVVLEAIAKAIDEKGKPYYMVKNSWGETGMYKGKWYMSRDFIALNTTYIFLNRDALPKELRKATSTPYISN